MSWTQPTHQIPDMDKPQTCDEEFHYLLETIYM